ncbi:MAG: dihydroorotase [Ruminococcus sp.]|nr:dihydroorotase [Ruminococcus sp.]
MKRLLFKNARLAGGKITSILTEGSLIKAVGEDVSDDDAEIIDCKGRLYLLNGLCDMHVHFRDPGQTHKEDILTGADAAKAGGFTAVACMPNTTPAVDNEETIRYIQNKAKETGIDIIPIACVTKGMKGEALADYDNYLALGIKAISDDGRPVENAELMRQALEKSVSNGLLVTSHCEDLKIINGGIINKGEVSHALGVKGMDRASEDYITAREIALAASCGARIHICHVSTKGSVNIIRAAKRDGVRVTCETAPHYFTFTDDKLLKRDADYRMNPPLREESDRKAIEQAVIDGTIDCIVTDHAPHTAEEKADFLTAPNGVVGLETSLSAVLTKLYHTGKLSLTDVQRIMSQNPRQILGLHELKIEEGYPADFTVVDTDLEWTVDKDKLHSKSKNSVFKGKRLKGRAVMTVSKGEIVYSL